MQCRAIAVHGDAASGILEQEEDQGAALIAKACHAELHLLHVVHPLALYPNPVSTTVEFFP